MTSRSAVDATRFTATSPHAYSKQSPLRSSSTVNQSQALNTPHAGGTPPTKNGSPPPESAQQKVARLRAARAALRREQLTTWERTVIRGRVWADRAHRFTLWSIISFSVVAAGVTTFALTDMILHNRRKRRAFYDEQHLIYNTRLVAAIETEKAGIPLDPDQATVLGRERNRVQELDRRKALGTWGRAREGIKGAFSTTSVDDPRIPVPSEAEVLEKIGVSSVGVLEASQVKGNVLKKDDLLVGEALSPRDTIAGMRGDSAEGVDMEHSGRLPLSKGGILDQLADKAVQDAKGKVNSGSLGKWFGWGGGGGGGRSR